jgi:serine/threonine protein kinase
VEHVSLSKEIFLMRKTTPFERSPSTPALTSICDGRLKRSPSTPALASICDGLKRSSSRLAFPAPPITQSHSSNIQLHRRGDVTAEVPSEDEDDLWWGAGKRGGSESRLSHNKSSLPVSQPPLNPVEPHAETGGTVELETILQNLLSSSMTWAKSSEEDIRRRYRFGGTVGSGLTADVFVGHAANGKHVALKAYKNLGSVWRWVDQPSALRANEQRDPILRGIRHLLSECRCLEHLKANLKSTSSTLGLGEGFMENFGVNLVEVVMTEKCTYLIQQFGGERTLFDVMDQCRGNEPFARGVIKQVLLNVQVCHESGMVHRDIKPDNILVSYKNEPWEEDRGCKVITRAPPSKFASNFRELMEVDEDLYEASFSSSTMKSTSASDSSLLPIIRLVDFGLGCILNRDETGNYVKLSGACGTPLYAAPEVLRSSATNVPAARFMGDSCYDGIKADMYGVGVILYALLCGRLPFEADSLQELQNTACLGNIAFPAYLSQSAKDLVQGLMCTDASARLSAGGALKHPWLDERSLPSTAPAAGGEGFRLSEYDDYDEETYEDDEGGAGMWYC